MSEEVKVLLLLEGLEVLELEVLKEEAKERKRKGLRRRSPASLSIQDTSESGEENTLSITPSADTPRNIVKCGNAI